MLIRSNYSTTYSHFSDQLCDDTCVLQAVWHAWDSHLLHCFGKKGILVEKFCQWWRQNNEDYLQAEQWQPSKLSSKITHWHHFWHSLESAFSVTLSCCFYYSDGISLNLVPITLPAGWRPIDPPILHYSAWQGASGSWSFLALGNESRLHSSCVSPGINSVYCVVHSFAKQFWPGGSWGHVGFFRFCCKMHLELVLDNPFVWVIFLRALASHLG